MVHVHVYRPVCFEANADNWASYRPTPLPTVDAYDQLLRHRRSTKGQAP
ncbi:hypothetical protein [Streptomyces sp. NPDC006510]